MNEAAVTEMYFTTYVSFSYIGLKYFISHVSSVTRLLFMRETRKNKLECFIYYSELAMRFHVWTLSFFHCIIQFTSNLFVPFAHFVCSCELFEKIFLLFNVAEKLQYNIYHICSTVRSVYEYIKTLNII